MSGDLAGLTLDAVLGDKQAQPTPTATAQMNRTLLDIIRDEEPHGSLFGHKDKKSWKAFRDRLRLKRAGAAWTSTVPIPASDIPIYNANSTASNFNQSRSLMSRRNSVRFTTLSSGDHSPRLEEDDNGYHNNDHPPAPAQAVSVSGSARPFMVRRVSSRYGSSLLPDENIHAVGDEPQSRSFRPQMSRHNSTRNGESPFTGGGEDEVAREGGGGSGRRLGAALAEERALSAREAVAAQEAAEAEAAAQAAAEAAEEDEGNSPGAEEAQPVRMSLMDLLEETDRQMGFVGSRYTIGDDDEECEEEQEDEDDNGVDGGDGIEHTCCVCMVRHKGAAFIPCGHTFCRLCSRELWVQRGNCPLCNGFIVEILDIF
ncbi:uncharacterized protein LOC8264942 isoform X2 [Ricinus communis]|uniref:RING-type domain-containing protein n=2 Tax=Ricinus communis TaxID=3988 RepID=B9S513_RICCO|nr:uncharacterized protein LOC8264942 isoform X2 [Ricinus communis]XP_015575961.1 uncharacterized protein LOC8264942 isoform X2 [Ricinus communis]XP_015575963.1 uncharacterized protein LOC8264942 isoform X2 [Ricinus communis]EEF41233.1 hypothetical protein RCOM_1719530 [Ricinus communis]|eukprot:XP_002521082.1 uncharacterized protein LOC8264942 isoform X2 [Ricinus communis]